MKQYLDIVRNVLENGRPKPNRTGIDTIAVPNLHFSHDMSNGFPLLTTKKMAFKSMRVELEGFLKGVTSKRWYQERGSQIWNAWANPRIVQQKLEIAAQEWNNTTDRNFDYAWTKKIENKKRKKIQTKEDDLGPIYGFGWRRFGEAYDENDDAPTKGYDQLQYIVDTLHKNPNDRRMVCSAWNPNQLDIMALPPCHLIWVLTHVDGVLNLHWTQRSCDLMLGVPFNIASYGLLLTLLCKEAGLTPGNLSGMLCDCHIYENQIDGAEEQITRTPKPLPQLEITNWKDIFNWTHKDVKLINYNSYDKIDFGEIAV